MKTVVLAESDETVRELLGEILLVLGYAWIEAQNIEQVFSVLKDGQPFLLLLNLDMPGVENLIQQLKADPVSQRLPIIGITAEEMDVLPAHVDDVLVKPFTVSVLRDKLARYLAVA